MKYRKECKTTKRERGLSRILITRRIFFDVSTTRLALSAFRRIPSAPIRSDKLFGPRLTKLISAARGYTSLGPGRGPGVEKSSPVVKTSTSLAKFRDLREAVRDATRPLDAAHTSNSPSRSTRFRGLSQRAGSPRVDRHYERRNWIVILFSKAICKCYQKFSGHASAHSPARASNPPPSERARTTIEAAAIPFLSARARARGLPPPLFLDESATTHRPATRARSGGGAASEFRIFRRVSRRRRRESATRESVMVSAFPKFRRRRDFLSRAFIGP